MFKKKNIKKNLLEEYIYKQEIEDKFILDDNNAIIVIENKDKTINKDYIMIHIPI